MISKQSGQLILNITADEPLPEKKHQWLFALTHKKYSYKKKMKHLKYNRTEQTKKDVLANKIPTEAVLLFLK